MEDHKVNIDEMVNRFLGWKLPHDFAPDGGHEGHPLTGNAYVMNEAGKTIASHGCY